MLTGYLGTWSLEKSIFHFHNGNYVQLIKWIKGLYRDGFHICRSSKKRKGNSLDPIVDEELGELSSKTGVGGFDEDEHFGVAAEPCGGAMFARGADR